MRGKCLGDNYCARGLQLQPIIGPPAAPNREPISFISLALSWKKQTRACSGWNCSTMREFALLHKSDHSKPKRMNFFAYSKLRSIQPSGTRDGERLRR